MYLDANNLYGCAMSQSLPHGQFQWQSVDDITINKVLKTPINFDTEFILVVHLEYPNSKHDEHKDLQFCVEQFVFGDLSMTS